MSQLNITNRPVDALIPYARNSRTHSDAQVAKIAGSLDEFGMVGAIVVRDGFSNVFEVGEGARVHMRRVRTGERSGERVEILQGVAPQARIVRQGGTFLNDGDTVRVAADAPTPAPGDSEPNPAQTPAGQAQTAIK